MTKRTERLTRQYLRLASLNETQIRNRDPRSKSTRIRMTRLAEKIAPIYGIKDPFHVYHFLVCGAPVPGTY